MSQIHSKSCGNDYFVITFAIFFEIYSKMTNTL